MSHPVVPTAHAAQTSRSFVRAWLALALGLLVVSLPAQQQPTHFRRISLEQGLSQSIVNSIIHDRIGFVWFATEEGINIYDGYRFRVLKNDQNDTGSLSYNQVLFLHEDRSGAIWAGIFAGGLDRYDPRTGKFRHFRHDPLNPSTLSSNTILTIAEDAWGDLWVGSDRGLDHVTTDGSVVRIQRVAAVGGADTNTFRGVVRSVIVDRSNRLWVGTAAGLSVASLTAEHRSAALVPEFHRFLATGKEGTLRNDNVRTLFEDARGGIWIGTDGGLHRASAFRGSDGSLTVRFKFVGVQGDLSRNPVQQQIYALEEDRDGYLWVGTNGGLDRFDRTGFRFEHFRNDPRDPTSLSNNEIRSIHEDRSGNLWVGTYGGGVSQLDRGRKRFTHLRPDPDDPNSLNRPIVWSIYEDSEGILWIGTHTGGLNRYDRRTGQFRHYMNDPHNPASISNNVVRYIMEDRRGRLWLATDGGGVCEFDRRSGRSRRFERNEGDPNSLISNAVRILYEDRQGILWIGTQGGGLERLVRNDSGEPSHFEHHLNDPADTTSISSNHVRWLHEDRDGTLWVATIGGGLERHDRATGAFTHMRARPEDPNALSSDYLMSIHEDRNGQLWLASWGGGVMMLSRDRQTITRYTEADGLPSSSIYGFLEDASGRLWMSSNNGISRLDPETRAFRNYGVADGLQSMEFDAGAFLKSRTGEMFFGGINGVNSFYPEEIVDNTYIPPVVLTSVRRQSEEVRFDRPVSDVREIELFPSDIVVAFQFAALDYTAPQRNRYVYRMEGIDDRWIAADPEFRVAQYTTLPPGRYTFRVRASNNDNQWNQEGLAVSLTVHAPWWATLWFRGLVFISVMGIGFVAIRRRVLGARLAAELRAAHDAQMSIMPQEPLRSDVCEVAGRCVPANEVGGDFFDYRWMDEKGTSVAVMVGDVSGKAMKAAMTAVMTSGALSAEVMKDRPADAVLTSVNPFVFEKTDRQVFVAACLVLVDVGKRTLRFSNAGLVDPLLHREGVVRSLKALGLRHPLGLLKSTLYREQKVALRRGDVVILVSDGVTEARNHAGGFYGEERLIALLERMEVARLDAPAIVSRILDAVTGFSDHAGQHDDLTVVAIKVL